MLVSVLGNAVGHAKDPSFNDFRVWLDGLCEKTVIKDGSVTKGLLSMLLKVSEMEETLGLARTLAQNVKLHLESLAPDDSNTTFKEYRLVSQEHSEQWLPALLISTFGSALDELEWFNTRMQPRLSAKDPAWGIKALEVLSHRLLSVLQFSVQLVQTEQTASIFDLFKYLRRLYNLCCSVAKSQILLFGSRQKTDTRLILSNEVRSMLEYTGGYTQDVRTH